MRKYIFALLIFSFVVISFSSIYGQNEEKPHVFTVTVFDSQNPEGGSNSEFDSLNTIYTQNVIDKNEYIISQRNLFHLWGSNSTDMVFITEYAKFEDIEKAADRNGELFRETWTTPEERRAFNSAYQKYFGKHSDEIYQEISSGRK